VIEDGQKVSIEYTLTLDDGTLVETNVDRDPLTYEHGQQEILPALERALTSLDVNDTTKVSLSADQGYGAVDPEAFQAIDKDLVPEEGRREGIMLSVPDGRGGQHPVRVHEVRDDKIVIDFNHPLAGQNLNFEVRILDIQ
jgi:FKBP-type peptidyl-prolyl cis-trans isomerase 2